MTSHEAMTKPPAPAEEPDDMPAEIDFTGALRGKFYRPDADPDPGAWLVLSAAAFAKVWDNPEDEAYDPT